MSNSPERIITESWEGDDVEYVRADLCDRQRALADVLAAVETLEAQSEGESWNRGFDDATGKILAAIRRLMEKP